MMGQNANIGQAFLVVLLIVMAAIIASVIFTLKRTRSKKTRRQYYRIVAVLKEFDTTKSLNDNDEAHYDSWKLCPETYNCFRAYYDLYAEEDNVKVFEKGGVCDSNFDEEDADLA